MTEVERAGEALETSASGDAAASDPAVAKGKSTTGLLGILGVVSLVLGQTATILTHVESLRSQILQWLDLGGFIKFHNFVSLAASALAALGFALLFWWLYSIYLRFRSPAQRRLAIPAGIAGVPIIALLTYLAVAPTSDPMLLKGQASRLASTILAHQVQGNTDDGGFRFSATGASPDAQPWTTAQCLVALLARPLDKDGAASARRALAYLERTRVPGQGWGYFPSDRMGVTEIDAWVVLAELASMQPRGGEDMWAAEQRPTVVRNILRDLQDIVARQHSNGGWGPAPRTDRPVHTRTYSTAMAVWALVEARSNGLVSSDRAWRYDQNIRDGITWLLAHYTENRDGIGGWYPNPAVRRPTGDYTGLTAQVLFILHRAQNQFPYLAADDVFARAQTDFLNIGLSGSGPYQAFAARDVAINQRAHDSDRYLPGLSQVVPEAGDFKAESSTFLWYPWALATASEIASDEVDTGGERRAAERMLHILVGRIGEAVKFTAGDEGIYPAAELLFGLSQFLDSRAGQDEEAGAATGTGR